MDQTEFDKYKNWSVEDLYAEIANQTTGPGLLSKDKKQQASVGRSRFAAI